MSGKPTVTLELDVQRATLLLEGEPLVVELPPSGDRFVVYVVSERRDGADVVAIAHTFEGWNDGPASLVITAGVPR